MILTEVYLVAAVRFEAVFYNDLCVCRDRNVGFQRQN